MEVGDYGSPVKWAPVKQKTDKFNWVNIALHYREFHWAGPREIPFRVCVAEFHRAGTVQRLIHGLWHIEHVDPFNDRRNRAGRINISRC